MVSLTSWRRFGENLYAYCKEKKDWVDAQACCQRHGATLVSIECKMEQEFIEKHFGRKRIWTSGSDFNEPGSWAWYSGYGPISYKNWNPGMPKKNSNKNKKNCLLLKKTGKWFPTRCSSKHTFVCEKNQKRFSSDSTWQKRSGKCYKKLDKAMKWMDSLKACQKLSANLLSIADADEEQFIENLYNGESIWTSAIDGMKPGTWIFTSAATSWDYTDWSPKGGQPNNRGGNEHCMVIKKLTGYSTGWYDNNCTESDIATKPVCQKLCSLP